MTELDSRPSLSSIGSKEWDVLVIGGGITGAGIMREIARLGKRVLLVEQGDFASGTSSRSSKMMHGGLHYLARHQFRLVRESVDERQRMLRSGGGLAEEVNFFLLTSQSDRPAWLTGFGLAIYDLLAGRFPVGHGFELARMVEIAPGLDLRRSIAAFKYQEARIDDARLVLRVLQEGCRMGGVALNYVQASDLLFGPQGDVVGARLCDREAGCAVSIRTRATINATGPWSDKLRAKLGAPPRLRLIRGSHLVFPKSRLPLEHVLALLHPDSRLPFYCIPWQGVTLVGSTNEEQAELTGSEPCVGAVEADYLLKGVQTLFPSLRLTRNDILCTFAGLRPIVGDQQTNPARASREDAIWIDSGMLTVTGGKLTTFRSMALKTLQKLRDRIPDLSAINPTVPILEPLPTDLFAAEGPLRIRRFMRYGPEGLSAILASSPDELSVIPGFGFSKAELRWVLEKEAVLHLDDLLLRRFRFGLTHPRGCVPHLENIRILVQSELGWDDSRWQAEVGAYSRYYQRAHGVPEMST
jgi:glycerol-3-phosphate dehydrogenase